MTEQETYLHLYDTDSAFTEDYNGEIYHKPWVSYTLENKEVNYNKKKPAPIRMSVQELIDNGYAEAKQDGTRKLPGSETSWNVIQIHQSCPIALEDITDFDDYLTSATTFVWREELPDGWIPGDLVAKYDGVELARPIMPEMFPCVDLSGAEELTLSFNGGGYQYTHSSIVSERYDDNHNYYPGVTFKTPKHLIVTIRDNYGTVAQTNFSMLSTTTAITLNCNGLFRCHDVTGMFEGNPELEVLEINGPFRVDDWRTCHLVFDGCNKLKSIPYVLDWGRDSIYNTIYPRYDGIRGSANCGGIFNAQGLEFIGPRLDMNAISLSGCTIDGANQAPLPYDGKGVFYCPELTDARIINLNNNDWNFADNSTYTYAPKLDVTSIEYILNNVADCSSDPHTITFSTLHQGEINQTAIDNAYAKGWSVDYQAV